MNVLFEDNPNMRQTKQDFKTTEKYCMTWRKWLSGTYMCVCVCVYVCVCVCVWVVGRCGGGDVM